MKKVKLILMGILALSIVMAGCTSKSSVTNNSKSNTQIALQKDSNGLSKEDSNYYSKIITSYLSDIYNYDISKTKDASILSKYYIIQSDWEGDFSLPGVLKPAQLVSQPVKSKIVGSPILKLFKSGKDGSVVAEFKVNTVTTDSKGEDTETLVGGLLNIRDKSKGDKIISDPSGLFKVTKQNDDWNIWVFQLNNAGVLANSDATKKIEDKIKGDYKDKFAGVKIDYAILGHRDDMTTVGFTAYGILNDKDKKINAVIYGLYDTEEASVVYTGSVWEM